MKEEVQKANWKYKELTVTIAAIIGLVLSTILLLQGNTIIAALQALLIISIITYYYPKPLLFLGKIRLKGNKSIILYSLALLGIVLYIISSSNSVIGFITFIILLITALNEFLPEESGLQGIKKAGAEIVYSILLAITVWTLLILVLNTQTPINVVTSCSMLPTLERGDLLVLSGSHPETQEIIVNTTMNEFMSSIIPIPEPCTIKTGTTTREDRCIKSIHYNNTKYNLTEGDILVYTPKTEYKPLEQTLANYEYIVHRSVLKIKATDGTYYLTKGDNNPTPDQIIVTPKNIAQQLNQEGRFNILCFEDSKAGQICTINPWIKPIKEEEVIGTKVLRIPYIGYAKLLLFGQTQLPENCNQQIQ